MSAREPVGIEPTLLCVAASSRAELAAVVDAIAVERVEPEALPAFARAHRSSGPYRLAVIAASPNDVFRALRAALHEHATDDRRPRFGPPEIAFVFPGQGVQRQGMGLELLTLAPFRDALAILDGHLRPHLGAPLAEIFASPALDDTRTTQPATIALSVALAQTLRALGVQATAAIGHSVGELGAAWLAGVLPLGAMLELVTARARAMAALPERGAMALVRAPDDAVRALLGDGVEIAALNGPTSTVISGPVPAVAATLTRAAAAGLESRPLAISQASHCALLDPMLDAWQATVEAIAPTAELPTLTLASTLAGGIFGCLGGLGLAPDRPDARYWRRHAREPVRFAAAVQALADRGAEVFIELAPAPSLSRLGPTLTPDRAWLPVLDPQLPDRLALLELLAELHRRGADLSAW